MAPSPLWRLPPPASVASSPPSSRPQAVAPRPLWRLPPPASVASPPSSVELGLVCCNRRPFVVRSQPWPRSLDQDGHDSFGLTIDCSLIFMIIWLWLFWRDFWVVGLTTVHLFFHGFFDFDCFDEFSWRLFLLMNPGQWFYGFVASPIERILLMSTKTECKQTKMHPLDKCRAYQNQITFSESLSHVWKFYNIPVLNQLKE